MCFQLYITLGSEMIYLKLAFFKKILKQPARNSIIAAAKVWPNIPPPNAQTAPVTVPLCNGCGAKGSGKETPLSLATSLGKATSKFGK